MLCVCREAASVSPALRHLSVQVLVSVASARPRPVVPPRQPLLRDHDDVVLARRSHGGIHDHRRVCVDTAECRPHVCAVSTPHVAGSVGPAARRHGERRWRRVGSLGVARPVVGPPRVHAADAGARRLPAVLVHVGAAARRRRRRGGSSRRQLAAVPAVQRRGAGAVADDGRRGSAARAVRRVFDAAARAGAAVPRDALPPRPTTDLTVVVRLSHAAADIIILAVRLPARRI